MRERESEGGEKEDRFKNIHVSGRVVVVVVVVPIIFSSLSFFLILSYIYTTYKYKTQNGLKSKKTRKKYS